MSSLCIHSQLRFCPPGLAQETHFFRKMFEACRTAQLAAGPEIDRLRRREEELLREVRRQNNERVKFEIQLFRTVPSYLARDLVIQDM